MTRPTKAEWEDLATELGGRFGFAHLRADGYLVTLDKVQVSETRLQIAVCVDGYMRGEWCQRVEREEELADIPRRFCRLIRRQKMKGNMLKLYEKMHGKRECRKRGYYDPWFQTTPFWNRARSLITHLKRHNQDIEILDLDTYRAALTAKVDAGEAP